MFADEVGADGYGQNASAAVDLFLRLAKGEEIPAPSPTPIAPGGSQGLSSERTPGGKLTTYKILYWQEIPSQIKAEDDAGNTISIELGQKVTEYIDAQAQKRGVTNADAYTAQWKWSEEQERPGPAHDVVEALKNELTASINF
jgi:hypothetical protein